MTDLAMHRYESSAENKFWQYELTGAELLVEYGKIGASGKQRQHKTFASEDLAKNELAKLVAKKEKEGFVAVGASGAPAPSPAPVPTPIPKAAPPVAATATASIAPRLVWNEEAESNAKNDHATAFEGDAQSWLASIAAFYAETNQWQKEPRTEYMRAGLSKAPTPAARQWAERILATYAVKKAPPALDVEGDAALLADGAPSDAAIAYILDRGGLVQLAKTLVASMAVSSCYLGGQGGTFVYFEPKPVENAYRSGPMWQAAACIRARIDQAKPAERDEVIRLLDAARSSSSLGGRILYAFASNDPAWAAEVTNEYLSAKKEATHYDMPNLLFDFVRDPALVTKLAKRSPSSVPSYVLLKEMGLDATDAVIARHDKDPNNEWVASALAIVESLPAAKQMAQSLGKKRANDVAKAYFERRPDLAIAVLEPIVKSDQKLAPYAKPVLDAILRARPELGSGEKKPAAKVAKSVPLVLAQAPKLKRSVSLPDFAKGLPQVLLHDGTALPDSAVQNLLLMLHESTIDKPNDALLAAKRELDEKSLAAFAWALFESWLAASGSSKEGWAFTALGHLGGDDEARKLAPLVRAWPGESQHARAVTGLSVLGAIGTDVALMHLHGIAQKVKFKGLQEKARAKMDELAKARGLTADELADRLVPDLGLDDTGSLSLDFGSRKFTVGFDEELKPFVLDGSGKKIGELPKPNKSDDAAVAGESVERWKTLKKDAKTVASTQITRLENAMCAQRRWKADDYRAFIVDHPLVVHLARRLVWGMFDGQKLGQTFRVAEDRTLVSADDVEVKLSKDAIVGLVHRLDMDEKTLAAWGEHLGNYQILQPFDQLGRALHAIEAAEKKSASLDRTKGVKVKTGKVLGLEVRGWRKGPPQDAGWVWEMNKTIGKLELTLPLGGGICMGWHEGTPSEQELGAVSIAALDGAKANFGMLSPVVFSELVRELEMLRDA